MLKGRLSNDLDLCGAIAVLAFYLKWARGQVAGGERSTTEVHLALAGALLVGLAYRLFWQKVSPKVAEPIARVKSIASACWRAGTVWMGGGVGDAGSRCEPVVASVGCTAEEASASCKFANGFSVVSAPALLASRFGHCLAHWADYPADRDGNTGICTHAGGEPLPGVGLRCFPFVRSGWRDMVTGCAYGRDPCSTAGTAFDGGIWGQPSADSRAHALEGVARWCLGQATA